MHLQWKSLIIGFLIGLLLSSLILLLINPCNSRIEPSACSRTSGLEEGLTATDYLFEFENTPNNVTKMSKIELNRATLEELMSLPGIGEAKAKGILLFRQTYGNYLTIDELMYVPGISETLYNEISTYVYIEAEE